MIKIRALRPSDLKQVLALLTRYSDQESEYSLLKNMQQLYIPLHRLSQLLPPHRQYVPAIFVATTGRKVLGLIWLSRDGRQPRRWKIDHLILDPDSSSYDVGTQLVHYVINRYGGEGVQTFLAYVDQHYTVGLGLLKSCGFRRCARLHYFSHQNPSQLRLEPIGLDNIRESSQQDCERIATIYNEALPPEARVCLAKQKEDFQRPFTQRCSEKMQGLFFKRWVAQDMARDCLIASLELTTADYQDFYLRLIVSPGWEHTYRDVLTYGIQQVLLITGGGKVNIDCYEFAKAGLEVLEQLGFTRNSIAEVLVKDYWIPIEDKGTRLQSPILLFSNRTSPAINCRP